MRFILSLIILSLLLEGCDEQRVYEDNKDFEQRIWLASDTAIFEFQIPPGLDRYTLQCNIRNSIDYPYSRIFVNFILEDSLGNLMGRKLVPNYLFEVKTGQPLGRSGLGDIYDHRFPLLENYEIKPGWYRLKLLQFMREDSLKGILAAGIRVEKATIADQ